MPTSTPPGPSPTSAVTHVLNWSLGEADRHLKAGIAYCADRDLDTWHRYMTRLARPLAGRAGPVRHGGTAPRRGPASPARVADHPGQRPARGRRARGQARPRRYRGAGRGPRDRRPDGGVPAPGAGGRGPGRGGVDRRAARRPGGRDRPRLGGRRRASAALGARRAQLVAAPRRGAPAGPHGPGAAVRAHAGGRAPGGRRRVGRPGLPAVVRLRAGVLPAAQGRAAVPGPARPARRPGRAPRRAARPARSRPAGAPRPPAGPPRQPGRPHGPRDRGAPASRRRAVLRRGRGAARPVREDGGPPRLVRAAQAAGAHPVPGGRHGPAARGSIPPR